MDTHTLSVLENAIEPYLQAGYVVTAQSDWSITLAGRPKRFSYLGFILALLVFWPAAVIYLVVHNNRRERSICLRITSDGYLEESGYTIETAAAERRREQRVIVLVTLLSAFAVAILLLFLTNRA